MVKCAGGCLGSQEESRYGERGISYPHFHSPGVSLGNGGRGKTLPVADHELSRVLMWGHMASSGVTVERRDEFYSWGVSKIYGESTAKSRVKKGPNLY